MRPIALKIAFLAIMQQARDRDRSAFWRRLELSDTMAVLLLAASYQSRDTSAGLKVDSMSYAYSHILLFESTRTADEEQRALEREYRPRRPRRAAGDEKGRYAEASAPIAHLSAAPSNAAFELWLQEKLQTLYGSVVDEPIPEDLIKVIEDLQRGKKD